MGVARLMLFALAACASAGAEPERTETKDVRSGIATPSGWQASPAIAAASRIAASAMPGAVIEGLEAWAEPARGCYAIWIALRGAPDADPDEIATQVVEGITAQQITASDVTPIAEGTFWVTFARPPYRGRLRVRLVDGRIGTLACFANDREPVACTPACNAMLEGFR